jgi:ribosomal protein S8
MVLGSIGRRLATVLKKSDNRQRCSAIDAIKYIASRRREFYVSRIKIPKTQDSPGLLAIVFEQPRYTHVVRPPHP